MEQAASLGVFGALQKMTETFRGVLPVFILLSLTAGVWLYYLLVSRHEPTDRTFGEAVRAFLRFERMFWPLLGRVLYLSVSVFLVMSGVLTMVAVNFFGGLVGTAILLVVVRILFEMTLVLFSLHERILRLEGLNAPERRKRTAVAGESQSAAGDRRPADDDRRTIAGDRRAATGDRRAAAVELRPAAVDRRLAGADRRSAAGEHRSDAVRRKDFRMLRSVRGMSGLMAFKRKGRQPIPPDDAESPRE